MLCHCQYSFPVFILFISWSLRCGVMDDEYETEDIPVGDYGGSDIDIDSDDGGMSLNE